MKTIVITGSTDGIGKLTALNLAKQGHTIYLHGRHQQKLETVISEIKQASNNENIYGFVADFSDLDAVKKLAYEITEAVPNLDVLINNAGVFKSSIQTTKTGLDIRFVVNYLAPYLLTEQLLPLLQQSNAPRVINLSSAAQSSVSINALRGAQSISEQEAYAQSKLALTMWSFHLAKNHPKTLVIAVNPGSLLNTNMVKEAYGNFWASADKGASILSDLVISDAYKNKSGTYFDNDKGNFSNAHKDAYNEQKIKVLISETNHILNL